MIILFDDYPIDKQDATGEITLEKYEEFNCSTCWIYFLIYELNLKVDWSIDGDYNRFFIDF